ncbi:MAG TPA: hypothetical protein VMJ65_16565, partial [Solirubrobacteraceae bacterium]|nr:hypothetical protein [Solirubrobacteraceae bacterium]
AVLVKSGSYWGAYATEVKGRLKPRFPGCVRVIWKGLATVADGDAAGREDRRAVGELGFVAGGRGSPATPAGGRISGASVGWAKTPARSAEEGGASVALLLVMSRFAGERP